jgi:hypothetical protein
VTAGGAPALAGMVDAAARYAELSRAAADLSDRALAASAKWAAEMLCGLPPGAAGGAAEQLAADATARGAATDPPQLMLARACFADRVRRKLPRSDHAAARPSLNAAALPGRREGGPAALAGGGKGSPLGSQRESQRHHRRGSAEPPAAARPMNLLAPITDAHPHAQEYSRAAHILAALTPPPGPPPPAGGAAAKALFLRAYCLYLAGEKRRE